MPLGEQPDRDAMTQFVVIDTETTGLQPSDRIVEFACAVLDDTGAVIKRMDTVIDPGRHPGPVRLHGITAEMTWAAPTFGALARSVCHLLNGKVVVGHNLAFDWMVLRKEFQRLGARVPTNAGGLCTAELSFLAFGRSVSLKAACEMLDIDLSTQHRASTDVEATARLLQVLRTRLDPLPPHRALIIGCRLGALPVPRSPLPRADVLALADQPKGSDSR